MLFFKTENVNEIIDGRKTCTIRGTGKKVKIGSEHQARLNFQTPPFAILKIVKDEPISLKDIDDKLLNKLGHSSLEEYLDKQKKWNKSSKRHLITFDVISVDRDVVKLINGGKEMKTKTTTQGKMTDESNKNGGKNMRNMKNNKNGKMTDENKNNGGKNMKIEEINETLEKMQKDRGTTTIISKTTIVENKDKGGNTMKFEEVKEKRILKDENGVIVFINEDGNKDIVRFKPNDKSDHKNALEKVPKVAFKRGHMNIANESKLHEPTVIANDDVMTLLAKSRKATELQTRKEKYEARTAKKAIKTKKSKRSGKKTTSKIKRGGRRNMKFVNMDTEIQRINEFIGGKDPEFAKAHFGMFGIETTNYRHSAYGMIPKSRELISYKVSIIDPAQYILMIPIKKVAFKPIILIDVVIGNIGRETPRFAETGIVVNNMTQARKYIRTLAATRNFKSKIEKVCNSNNKVTSGNKADAHFISSLQKDVKISNRKITGNPRRVQNKPQKMPKSMSDLDMSMVYVGK